MKDLVDRERGKRLRVEPVAAGPLLLYARLLNPFSLTWQAPSLARGLSDCESG